MPIPDRVMRAILDEQKGQDESSVLESSEYFKKLSEYAELVTHQQRDELLGYVFFYCNDPSKRVSYITLIGTSTEARGSGVGFALLQYVLSITKVRGFSCCRLEVRKDNTRACAFYKRAGFVVVEDRGDKFLMSLDLQDRH